MKKPIVFLISILSLLSLTSFAQKITKFEMEEDDDLNITLSGKVNTIQIKTEYLKSKSADSLVYFFNDKGSPYKIVKYGLGLDAIFKKLVNEEVHYEFKENKLLSKLNNRGFGIDGDVYEYDGDWNLISLKEYMSNILVKETIWKYDDRNRKTEKTEYLYGGFSDYNPKSEENKQKFLYEIEKYEYNNHDKIILKFTFHFRENKTVQLTQYKYDENNNLIEEGNCVSYGEPNCEIKPVFGYLYNSKNLITKKYQLAKFSPHNTDQYYYYDENDNEIQVKGYYIYPDQEPILGYDYIYEYDKFGNQIKEEESIGKYRMIGFEKYKTQLTQYDKFQNLVSDEYINSEGLTIKVVIKNYTYDKKGNWLKMETFEGKNKNDLTLIEVSKREIKYF